MFKDSPAFSGFSVNNISEAKKFYGEILGLEIEENPMGLQLKIKGSNPVFIYEKSDHTPATFTILNFPVEDIDKAVEELAAKGVKFKKYEGFHQDEKAIARRKEANMGPDIAWFTDPAGNILSLLEN